MDPVVLLMDVTLKVGWIRRGKRTKEIYYCLEIDVLLLATL